MATAVNTTPLTVADDDFAEFEAFLAWKRRRGPVPAPPPPSRTVGQLHAEWLLTLGKVARKNRTSQGRHIRRPFNHQGRDVVLADVRAHEVTPALLTSWQTMLRNTPSVLHQGRNISPGTVHQVRMGLQSMFKHFIDQEPPEPGLVGNPFRRVKKVPGRDRLRQGYATPDVVERYADAMPAIGGWVARHMFATGCRIMNILRLQKHEIDWAGENLELTAKGDKQVIIPVPTKTMEELKHLCALSPSTWVYPNPRDPTRPIPYDTFTGWSHRARARLKLPTLVPHEFRHGAAVDMLDHDADIIEVMHQLAHSDIKLTARYAKIRGKAVDRVRARQNARFPK